MKPFFNFTIAYQMSTPLRLQSKKLLGAEYYI